MGDSLFFLGTGGDPTVTGKQTLASGGIVLKTEGMQFHIDPGPGALVHANAMKINPRENTAILVSHAHLAHCNDVNAIISATSFAGLDPQSVLICTKSLVEENNSYLTPFHKNGVERVIVVKEGDKVGLNKVEIHTLKAVHSDETAVGFKFLCPKFTLAYSGDTEYFKEMPALYKDVDLLILNVQEPFGRQKKGHLSADDVLTLLDKVRPNLLVLTHFGAKMLQSDLLNVGRDIHIKTGIQVVMAKDGMVINPVDASKGQRQKTLNVYD
jgi:ribonuclease BN (tRNA processing enzyme)